MMLTYFLSLKLNLLPSIGMRTIGFIALGTSLNIQLCNFSIEHTEHSGYC